MSKSARRYGGQSMEDRQAERRARLIEAAIHVFARFGRDGASVAAICAEAGLTARYFYESFPNSDALFVEAFHKVRDELFSRIEASLDGKDPVKAALTGFFTMLAQHPKEARVFMLDLEERDPAMKALGREGGRHLAKLFAPQATHLLTQAAVAGAVTQIAKRWIEQDFTTPIDQVVALALPFTKAAEA